MMATRSYTLVGADGKPYQSTEPGTLGGHRRSKIYGRLDCPGALRWIARGHYVRQRVFFRDEAAAIAAGFRPCAVCMPEQYRAWKSTRSGDKGA
jgi:hypothetical protein